MPDALLVRLRAGLRKEKKKKVRKSNQTRKIHKQKTERKKNRKLTR